MKVWRTSRRITPTTSTTHRGPHRGLGISIIAGLVASLGMTIGSLVPSSPAAAIDIIEFVSVNGVFDNPVGEDGNSPPCLQYRAGGANVSQANQSNDPATLNEIRFGDGSGSGCGSVDARSGFGFAGVETAGTYSSLFELGRFTHYNNPIASNPNNVGTTDLEASFVFRDLTDGSFITLSPVYQVTLDETPNNADPCAYPAGPNGNGCADRIVIDQPAPVTVAVGETTFTIDIGGFGTIDEDSGECDLNTVIPGNSVLTPEGGATTFCVYGTASQSTLTIHKTSVGGDGTFDFLHQEYSQRPDQLGTPVADSQVTTSIATTGGTGTSGVLTLEPGIYTLAEINLPAGVRAGALACTSDSEPSAYVTVDGVEYLDFDSGEAITCSITNTREASITITKDARPNAAQDFSFSTTGGSDLPDSFSLDDDADGALANSRTFSVLPGDYTVTEDALADWRLAGLTCVVTDHPDDDAATQSVTGATAQLHLGAGDAASCTFTNEATAQLLLAKTWLVAQQGDEATLTADVDGDGSADDTLVSTAGTAMPQTDVAPTAVTFVLGDDIDLAETVLPPENYDSSLECVGSDPAGVAAAGSLNTAPDGRSGTLATNAIEAAAGGTITCTFTNPRRAVTVEVVKDLVPATDDGTFTLSITGHAGGPATVTGGDAATTSATVNVGDTIDVAEIAGDTATDLADYDSTVSCVGPSVDVGGSTTARFVVPFEAADEMITCTFANTRRSADLTVEKSWVDARVGDEVSISTTGATNDVSFSAVAESATETDVDPTTYTVFAGESLTFDESFTVGDAAGYATTLVCAGAADQDATDGLDIDPADTAIACTYTNARSQATFTLDKDWVAANAGDAVDLDADGTDTNAEVVDTSSTAPTGSGGSMVVFSGETISFSETFTSGAAANYLTTLVCADGSGQLIGNSGQLSGRLTVTADPTDITCTFTNTRRTSSVVLQKEWIDGNAGDTARLTASGINNASVTSTASGAAGSDVDTTNQATIAQVFVGETIQLSEVLSAPADYDTAWACDDAARTSGSGTSGAVNVAPADENNTITCTITNTRKSADLVLTKSWADSPVNGDAVALAIAGGDAVAVAGANSNDGAANDSAASSLVYVGETLTLSEVFDTGDSADYETGLTCIGGELGDTSGLSGSLTVTPNDAGGTITCTFTNTRRRTSLTLDKAWVDPVGADEATLSLVATDSDVTTALAPAASGGSVETATITVYAGEQVAIGETIDPDGTNVALYDATAFACSAGTETPAWVAGDTNVSLDVTAADVAAPISCTFTNTARRGDILVVKAIDGDGAEFGFLGSWLDPPGFTLSPPADGSDQQLFENVLVPKDGTTYAVAEADPGARYGTTVMCADGVDGGTASGPSTPTAGLQGVVGLDHDELVTCTFNNTQNAIVTIVKVAEPQYEHGFDFTGDLGVFTVDDDGVGDNFVVFTNVVPGAYDVTETAATGWELTGIDCSDGQSTIPSTGSTATATATINAEPAEAITCTFTNTARPVVTIDKRLTGTPVVNADGSWTVSYDLTVENAADAGPGSYDLDDTFRFGGGVGIVDGSATASNAAPGTIVTLSDFDGVADTAIVRNQPIDPGANHTYTVTVDVDITVGPLTDGDCVDEGDEGTGFLNRMTVVVPGEEIPPAEACGEFATLTLVKDVVNDDGGNAVVADFTLTAAGPTPMSGRSGSGDVSKAVLVGDYSLSETQLDGYATEGFVCEGGTQQGTLVALVGGDHAVCTIVNDDEPIDLELTKDDGDFEAIAGGDPIPYTITVRNIGTRDADLGEPVTVTDELPAFLSWNTFPAQCAAAGQVLTCDIDPALMTAGGEAVVIDVLVDVAADAPSGVFENRAWVTTDDDPVCEGDDCTPPRCPAPDNNNVDCEETPLERFASVFITKADDVPDGDFVQPGDTYTYELVVGNLGPSTVLANLVVDDDLPAELSFVSTTADARWSCNDVDPLECTWTGGSVFPGDTLPAITVEVLVDDDATGTEIYNLAIVTALVDTFPESTEGLVRLSDAHFGGAGETVTAQDDEITPLTAITDLAVTKTAGVTQVGAGSGFDWVLDITNNGPGVAFAVSVGDIVPSAVTVTGVTSPDFACDHAGNAVTCTKASMAVGETGRVTIAVTVPNDAAAGTVDNVGTVESETPDSDLTNNSDDASVVVVAIAAPTTTLPPVTLPKTGSDATNRIVLVAMLLIGLGGAVMLITRRRREHGVA